MNTPEAAHLGNPGITDRYRLKQILREQEDFRDQLIGDEKVFQGLMDDREILVRGCRIPLNNLAVRLIDD